MIKTIFRLAGASFCGLILSLWILQNNPCVQQLLSEKIITSLEKDWKVRFDIGKLQANLFTCSLYCSHGVITPTDDKNFSWQFQECKVDVSLFDLLFKKKLSFGIVFNHITAQTHLALDCIDIVQHLYTMFQTDDDDLKIRPRWIKINNIDCEGVHEKNSIKTSLIGTFYLAKKSDIQHPERSWAGYLNLAAAHVLVNGKMIVNDISGKMGIYYDKRKDAWSFDTDAALQSTLLNSTGAYRIQGQWDAGKKMINVTNELDQTALTIQGEDGTLHAIGKLPIILVVRGINAVRQSRDQQLTPLEASGFCSVNVCASKQKESFTLQGGIKASKGSIEQLSWQSIDISCTMPKPFVVAGSITSQLSSSVLLKSLFAYDCKRAQGLIKVSNKAPINLIRGPLRAEWLIGTDQFKGIIHFDQASIKAQYSCHIIDASSDERVEVQGTGCMSNGLLYASGKVINQSIWPDAPSLFGLKAQYNPSFLIQRFIYQAQGERLIDIQAKKDDPKLLQGMLKYSLVHSYFDPTLQRSIFGSNCIFDFTVNQGSLAYINGTIELASGRFYIPESRNLITRFATHFALDFPARTIALSDAVIGFCKGALRCPRAVVSFNEQGQINSIHAPLCSDHLFINWKRDFYGFVYGNFLLSKTPTSRINLSGNVILERSLLRDTLLSQDALGNVSGPVGLFNIGSHQLGVDVAITTEKPIRVTTDALDTFAHLDMRVEYEHNNDILQFPRLSGTISLDGGDLKFLRNKLFIERGKIQFLTNQMSDPLIDLVAKNKINKYQIMLQVTGSLQKPTILLESSPELTEEQVFGLLLAGSEHTTLQAALPAMLMQHLHKILLGSKKHMSSGASIFEKLTKPLQYVQITPNFTDQSGRGGIKGTLSVDLNDQFHAQVQKNFNLQDDFSFYLQYMLSDDISLRAIKDQRGEIGSEVEVRLRL